MERYAVIMAGGAGTRLWPLSRENKPKQFLRPGNEKSMLRQTLERLQGIVDNKNLYVVANTQQKNLAEEALGGLILPSRVLLEPLRKNTAACITYAAMLLKKEFKNGILCCIPSDSWVLDEDRYRAALEIACREAESGNSIVVIGITPSFPATGYGYIQADMDKNQSGAAAFPVLQFAEKPCIEQAKVFVSSGEYLWNSGIVAGTIDCVLDNVKSFLPGLYETLAEAVPAMEGGENDGVLEEAYRKLDAVSFDRGVLEKSSQIVVVKGDFGWSDIGSLDALDFVFGTDLMGNTVSGNHMGINTCSSVIYSESGLVATVGLDNMIVVNTGDTVLVCPREKAQEIRELVELLKRNGYEKYL